MMWYVSRPSWTEHCTRFGRRSPVVFLSCTVESCTMNMLQSLAKVRLLPYAIFAGNQLYDAFQEVADETCQTPACIVLMDQTVKTRKVLRVKIEASPDTHCSPTLSGSWLHVWGTVVWMWHGKVHCQRGPFLHDERDEDTRGGNTHLWFWSDSWSWGHSVCLSLCTYRKGFSSNQEWHQKDGEGHHARIVKSFLSFRKRNSNLLEPMMLNVSKGKLDK